MVQFRPIVFQRGYFLFLLLFFIPFGSRFNVDEREYVHGKITILSEHAHQFTVQYRLNCVQPMLILLNKNTASLLTLLLIYNSFINNIVSVK